MSSRSKVTYLVRVFIVDATPTQERETKQVQTDATAAAIAPTKAVDATTYSCCKTGERDNRQQPVQTPRPQEIQPAHARDNHKPSSILSTIQTAKCQCTQAQMFIATAPYHAAPKHEHNSGKTCQKCQPNNMAFKRGIKTVHVHHADR